MNRDLFLKIISAALNKQALELDNLDKDFLLSAKEQTFLSYIWYVSRNEKYIEFYLRTGLILERIMEVAKYLDNIFNENAIDHAFLKGFHLKDIYPDPILRMCGDLDILIKPEDYSKVVELLKKHEEFKIGNESIHDFQFKYKGILVELHKELFEPHRVLSNIFNNPFDNVELIENHQYKLNDNYNFIYIVGHYAKHINMGAGLRPLCDIYLMLNKFDLDMDYINDKLNKMGLTKFFNLILNELNVIFGYDKLPFEKNDKVDEMIDYCLKSGVHGQGRKSNRVENSVNSIGNGNKFVYILKRVFITPKEMFAAYPWTKSIILLPFGYIFRFFKLLFTRSKKLKKVLKYKKSDRYYLMESIGLVNDKGKIF